MTLLLGLLNRDNAVLVSDRRLIENGVPVDEESNKAGVLVCRDARLVFAYTGCARQGSFQMNRWLPVALAESAEPDFLVGPMLERFRQKTSALVASLPARPVDKRLTIVFSGYQYVDDLPRAHLFRISNCEIGDPVCDLPVPQASFELEFWRDAQLEGEFGASHAYGMTAGLPLAPFDALVRMVKECRPPTALIGKALEIVRATAADPRSLDYVGAQCSSIVLPADLALSATAEYHSNTLSPVIYGPSYVMARGGEYGVRCYADIESGMELTDQPAPILRVPTVRPNAPCPCGSGSKYKRCHGRSTGGAPFSMG